MPTKSYEELAQSINGASLLGPPKLRVMHRALAALARYQVPGAAAEVGAYKGGSSLLIAEMLPNTMLYVYDTFTGIPVSGEKDRHKVGDFGDTSADAVWYLLEEHHSHVVMQVGMFPETTNAVDPDVKYCFVHCDGDQYQVTKDFLEYFYPRMSAGGIMIFDDYLWPDCPGVALALHEFLQDKPESITVEQEYQAIVQKQ